MSMFTIVDMSMFIIVDTEIDRPGLRCRVRGDDCGEGSEPVPSASGQIYGRRLQRRRQRPRQHIRYGVRAAALRAITAARLYLSGQIPNLLKASESCGSNTKYVIAAIILLRSENSALLDRVLRGHIPLLAAANQVRRLVELTAAYRATDEKDHITFARVAGPDRLFEEIVQAVA